MADFDEFIRGLSMSEQQFSEEEITKLEEEMKNKVLEHFSDQKDILDYLEFTLNNFSYRYLESESTGKLKVNWIINEGSSSGKLEVVALEGQLAESLKTKNKETRKGIIELAKNSKKSDNPKVKYRLGISWDDLEEGDINFLAYAAVNWGFPNYRDDEGLFNYKQKKFHYDDPYSMRNHFPRELEEVCEIL